MSEYVRFQYEKLVRDKVLDGMAEQGAKPHVVYLEGTELEDALVAKIDEELAEVHDDDSDLVKEIADVREVIDALENIDDLKESTTDKIVETLKTLGETAIKAGLSEDQILLAKKEKFERKGGFEKGAYVVWVDTLKTDDFYEHLMKNRDKYPILTQ